MLDQLCCTVVKTWELTFTDEARLCVVEHYIIRMMCGVKLINRLSTDVSQDRMGIVVKIQRYNSKPFVVVWSCHSLTHQLPNM